MNDFTSARADYWHYNYSTLSINAFFFPQLNSTSLSASKSRVDAIYFLNRTMRLGHNGRLWA